MHHLKLSLIQLIQVISLDKCCILNWCCYQCSPVFTMMPVMMFDVVFNVEIQLMQVIPVMQVDKCRFPKCGCRDAMQNLNTNTGTMKYASIEVIMMTQ